MDECVTSHDHSVIVVNLVLTLHFQPLYPNPYRFGLLRYLHSLREEESSKDGDTDGEEELLSAPLPPSRPHPLTTSQCPDVHRESKLFNSCVIG